MRSALAALLAAGCVDLEEKVHMFDNEWCAPRRSGYVVCAVDGDTVDLDQCSGGERIRLLGVAAPEIAHTEGETSECYGEEATAFLEQVVAWRSVNLEFDMDCIDPYGRTLAWVELEGAASDPLVPLLRELDDLGMNDDGSFSVLVNELVIRAGYARIYESDLAENVRYTSRLEEALAEAIAERRGLWQAGVCSDSGGG